MAHELKYSDITSKILKSAFEVHNVYGLGYQEVVYQWILVLEFTRNGLCYKFEIEHIIYYNNYEYIIGNRRADFIVEGKVVVELNARSMVEDAHKTQVPNYLKVFNLEVGLLLNFGAQSLEYKRFVCTSTNP